MRLLAIIPAYNEAENIERVIEELKQYDCDYVVVNDGSVDRTAAICCEKGYNLLDLPVNLGLTGAVQAGMKYAWRNGYDCALQLDGDGQHGVSPFVAVHSCWGDCPPWMAARSAISSSWSCEACHRALVGVRMAFRAICGARSCFTVCRKRLTET